MNVSIGGRIVSAEAVLASTDMPGLDEVHVRVPSDLRGAGAVNVSVISDGRESNPVIVNFIGDPSRAILINEVLADPPDAPQAMLITTAYATARRTNSSRWFMEVPATRLASAVDYQDSRQRKHD